MTPSRGVTLTVFALFACSVAAGSGCRSKARTPQTPSVASMPPPNVVEMHTVSAPELSDDVRRLLTIPTRPGASPAVVQVGRAPEAFPSDLLPSGTEIIASAVSDASVTVVGRRRTFTLIERSREFQRLEAAGWQRSGASRQWLMVGADGPLQACRGDQFLTTRFADRADGSVLIGVVRTVDPRRPCSAPPSAFPDLDAPLLFPPRGRTIAANGGSGSGRTHSNLTLQTPLSLRELSDHYAVQMAAAGWKFDGHVNDGDRVLVARFSIVSRIGDPVTAVLTIAALDSAPQYMMSFIVARNPPPGPGVPPPN